MKIFFDYQTFCQQLYGGISRYFCELITGINKTDNQAHLSLLHSNNAHLREYGLNVMPNYFPKRHRFSHLTNRTYNIVDFRSNSYDIYHATYFDPFFSKYIGRKPYVVTFYDMIYEKFGDRFDAIGENQTIIKWKQEISKNAAGLIAISENTKQDMVNYLGINPERIRVIYLSGSMKFDTHFSVETKRSQQPYILYVGNRGLYKNFIPFLKAVSPILKTYGLQLVCAGGQPFNNDERTVIKSCDVETNVEYRSVTDQVLADLYSNAVAFVYPSLYEGFGIPILEAMSCRCPCLLSNSSSLPEVAGEAALYFNPDDLDDMRSTLRKLMDDQSLRTQLIEAGIERAATFSWDRTVRETLSLYGEIIS